MILRDQRRPRLINQNRVHFVHNGVVVPALHAIFYFKLHVVAQVVEAEFVVGSVGDVGRIGRAALVVVQVVDDDADGEPQELVNLAHPLGIALGQVVVHRDHMHAVAGQGVQIAGQRGHQRFSFAGLHFADLALVQHHAADQLHVEVAHLHGPPPSLADHREGFGQNLVQSRALGRLFGVRVRDAFELGRNPLPELHGPGAQLLVRKLLRIFFEGVDGGYNRHQPLDHPLVRSAKNFGQGFIKKHRDLRLPV
jgi:hypothetical protein